MVTVLGLWSFLFNVKFLCCKREHSDILLQSVNICEMGYVQGLIFNIEKQYNLVGFWVYRNVHSAIDIAKHVLMPCFKYKPMKWNSRKEYLTFAPSDVIFTCQKVLPSYSLCCVVYLYWSVTQIKLTQNNRTLCHCTVLAYQRLNKLVLSWYTSVYCNHYIPNIKHFIKPLIATFKQKNRHLFF